MSCFVVLIVSVPRYKCDCTEYTRGRDVLLPFVSGGLATPGGYHAYPKVRRMSSKNLHEHVCYIIVFTEIDQSSERAVVSM
jgi:hypothetical protein